MSRNSRRSIKLDKIAPSPDSSSSSPAGPSSARPTSKSDARREAAELAKRQAAARKRRRAVVQGAIGAGVVALVVAVTVLLLSLRGPSTPEAVPPQVTSDGGFVVGDPDAPVTVTLVEDFQCPVCREFEATNADQLAQYAASGDVKLEYRGIAFLDRQSSTDYSSRALNASACVMGQGQDVWSAFHQALYEQQPPEGGDGLPDADLAQIATDAGADPDAVTGCIDDGTYRDWAAATTEATLGGEVQGTPTIFVDGQVVDGITTEALTTAVEQAQAG